MRSDETGPIPTSTLQLHAPDLERTPTLAVVALAVGLAAVIMAITLPALVTGIAAGIGIAAVVLGIGSPSTGASTAYYRVGAIVAGVAATLFGIISTIL